MRAGNDFDTEYNIIILMSVPMHEINISTKPL